MNTNYFFVLSASVLMFGCGPVFRTNYTYTPPESSHGRACVYSCDTTKVNCEHLERMREENCDERARLEKERCERDFELRGKKPKWSDCWSSSSCSANLDHCHQLYVSCYQSCGGKVRSEEVCVSNCDKIQR